MNDTMDEAAGGSASTRVDSNVSEQANTSDQNGYAMDSMHLQELGELKAENSDLRDKLLRAIAEMENFRRRTEREKTDLSKYAVSEFARDSVSIGDNLRRAIEAVQKEPLEQNPALKTLLEGVEATERELIRVFERHGITRFDPVGEKFDPHYHEAMVKVDVPNASADTIVQVFQAGYKIGDRVLRPAAVVVAKGGTTKPVRSPVNDLPDDAEIFMQSVKASTQKATADQDHVSATKTPDQDAPQTKSGAASAGARPGIATSPQRDRPANEKKGPSVTTPISGNGSQSNKDDLISSLGKRLDNIN